MKIAYIYNDKKSGTGAHYINQLIIEKLRERGTLVESYYPRLEILYTPIHFRGIHNILFFYSLLEKQEKILKCDIIQGTTYTPLAFMHFSTPVVSHFGSTTRGFLRSVPRTSDIEGECREIFHRLQSDKVMTELDLQTLRPLKDIALIERYAATQADRVIATSRLVQIDLIEQGIAPEKITLIHNAIEDYWFEVREECFSVHPTLVFLGRIGDDPFTMKIKGLDRLIFLYEQFPDIQKYSIMMSRNKKLLEWLSTHISRHELESNILKTDIPKKLSSLSGGILLIPSRYEGFSLSLIEGMSQGLVPIIFAIGVAPEVIRNGENGYIVESIADAREKIALLIADPILRKKLSGNARVSARDFSSEILIQKMTALYDEMGQEYKKSKK